MDVADKEDRVGPLVCEDGAIVDVASGDGVHDAANEIGDDGDVTQQEEDHQTPPRLRRGINVTISCRRQ